MYLAEAGGITGAGAPGVDVHWILCEDAEDTADEAVPVKETEESDGLPSIGVVSTMLSVLVASALVRRKQTDTEA